MQMDPKCLSSSVSLRTASVMCLGMMRDFLLSRAAFPESSSTSAVRYSSTAARYTGAPAPRHFAYRPERSLRATRDTGKISPDLLDLVLDVFLCPPRPPLRAETMDAIDAAWGRAIGG